MELLMLVVTIMMMVIRGMCMMPLSGHEESGQMLATEDRTHFRLCAR